MIPWDSCEVRFYIRNPNAVIMLGLNEELPAGWVVGPVGRDFRRHGYTLTFEVQGEVLETDGLLVQRILDRAGAFT